MALEIWKGRPRLLVNQGTGVLELLSDTAIDDGQWHNVRAQFNPSYLEVTVDSQKKSLRPRGSDRHINLNGLLYFGGIEPSKRGQAVSQGIQGANKATIGTYGGLRGCLQKLELDGRKIGLPEVLETSKIKAGCVWEYPCLSKSGGPCVMGSVCFQQGTSGFRCECDGPICTKAELGGINSNVMHKPPIPVSFTPFPLQLAHLTNGAQNGLCVQ